MSTNDLDKSDNPLYIKYVIQTSVHNLQAALAEYVRQKMNEQNLSTYDVERRSGGQITHGSVWNILNQRVKDVKASTLRALAKGLGITEEQIFAIARGKSTDGNLQLNESRLIEAFRTLPADKQDDVIAYVEMMRIRYGSGVDGQYQGIRERPLYSATAGTTKSIKGKKQKK